MSADLRFSGNLLGGGIATDLDCQPAEVARPHMLLSRFPVDGLLLCSIKVGLHEQLACSEEDGGAPIPLRAVLGMHLSLPSLGVDERMTLRIRNPGAGNVAFEALCVERMPLTPNDPGWGWLGARGGGK